ncbi:SsrA-binding protein [Planctomycetota bacterium]|nr:SsrA-binding protein [Planctomycetota bacterium]
MAGGLKNIAKPAPKPGAKARPDKPEVVEILYNRKLRHDFAVIDSWECGLALMGSEVKALRTKDVQWSDSHARIDHDGQVWLYNLHIGEWRYAAAYGHKPQRARALLLNRSEIDKITGKLKGKGLTLIPERLLFRRGWAKLVLCLCQHKDKEDQRADLIKRAQQRDVARELSRREKAR